MNLDQKIIQLSDATEIIYRSNGETHAKKYLVKNSAAKLIREVKIGNLMPAARMELLYILTILKPKNLTKKLITILNTDQSSDVRHEAAFYIGKLKLKKATADLIKSMLTDRSVVVRHESAEALGKLNDQTCVPALCKALKDKSREVRETAELSLEIIKLRKK